MIKKFEPRVGARRQAYFSLGILKAALADIGVAMRKASFRLQSNSYMDYKIWPD